MFSYNKIELTFETSIGFLGIVIYILPQAFTYLYSLVTTAKIGELI